MRILFAGFFLIAFWFLDLSHLGFNDNNFDSLIFYKLNNPELDSLRAQLGKLLFFDKRLSIDNSVSCATCHNPELAFCDNLKTSVGVNGYQSLRNAPSLLNVKNLKTVMFDAHLKTLELQVIVPIQEPLEMGQNMKTLVPKLRQIDYYQDMAKKLYNRDFDPYVLTRSIAAFERTLISMNSRYDQYVSGNDKALSSDEKKGMDLFMNKLNCIHCHPPPFFTTFEAENNGLTVPNTNDPGRFRVTKDSSDFGKFKIPSLRNISLTYPYMHDGSYLKLEDVINAYHKGGISNKNVNSEIIPLNINETEKENLISFLNCLTDTSYLKFFK